ncbi:MAG TPA: hypothetical protein PLS73_11165, partial [Saprospiraceae bacterium]|nr:hypothetical protein [Saprospiraceae bacterium]
STLLGLCLVVITSLHLTSQQENNLMDEITSVISLLLAAACIFSFISLRTQNHKLERKTEHIADILFMVSLGCILLLIVYIAYIVI